MSKREFIRNVRRAVGHRIDDDWCGHLYDDVNLNILAPSKFFFILKLVIKIRFICLDTLHRVEGDASNICRTEHH